jgi:hypothetical protein
MVYDRKKNEVYINYNEIWSVLEDHFGLNYTKILRFTKKWLSEVYNLRGVTTNILFPSDKKKLSEVYNLKRK